MSFDVNSFPFGSLLTSTKMTVLQDNDNQLLEYSQLRNVANILHAESMSENTGAVTSDVPVWVSSLFFGEYLECNRVDNDVGATISVTFLGVSIPAGVSSVQVNSCGWNNCAISAATGASDSFESVGIGIACVSGFTL